jgi:hypothetical protein
LPHVTVYVCAPTVAGFTTTEPELARVPDHPPDAVHDAACVELHVRVVACPTPVVAGLAERLAVATSP